MTGRGNPIRGVTRPYPGYILDNRRGRGRPRKFPLSNRPQMPTTTTPITTTQDVEREVGGEEFRGDDDDNEQSPPDYFHNEEGLNEEEEVVEEEGQVEIDETDLVEVNNHRVDMEKIKQLQHQKMLLVTPMAQKRIRGRPPRRQSTSSLALINEDILDEEEMLMLDGEVESGPMEGTSTDRKQPQTMMMGRATRQRHVPKRLHDFVVQTEKKGMSRGGELPIDESSLAENPIDHLISDDGHVEEEVIVEEEILKESSLDHQPTLAETAPTPDDTSAGPPPAPRHLVNKQNGRGRPANPIPPHRRPLPKDLMPPGTQTLKRSAVTRDSRDPKRKDTREKSLDPATSSKNLDEIPPLLHPPRVPISHITTSVGNPEEPLPLPSETPIDIKLEAPEAIEEVVIGGDDEEEDDEDHLGEGKKNPSKAGKDLPLEHKPKGKASHVSTHGIHPLIPEKEQLMTYDLRDDQEILIQDIEEDPEGGGTGEVAQQRVLTLQGGSFIEDRIGRADLMEDEEMKMMKQQYIVEENGVDVVYEVDPNDVIEEEEEVGGHEEMEAEGVVEVAHEVVEEDVDEEGRYVIERQDQVQQMKQEEDDDDDDDLPPQLIPEGVPNDAIGDDDPNNDQNKGMAGVVVDEEEDANFDFNLMEEGEPLRLQSPGGRSHDVRLARDAQGNTVFIDENGHIVELVTDTGALVEPGSIVEQQEHHMGEEEEVEDQDQDQEQNGKVKQQQQQRQRQEQGDEAGVPGTNDRANMEFMNSCSFLDVNNICCGLCGEIVIYEKLLSEHLPSAHPEYLSPGVELEEVPYNSWLKTRLKQESKMMENGFRHYDDSEAGGFGGAVRLYSKGLRQMRKVSQIRVNVNEMTMQQLEVALRRKLVEKMGRKVPVSLVDRLHARCDICQAVVSLNKKFEVVHLVRHFNAWHPAEHRCSQEWKELATAATNNNNIIRRPLSLHDFAVVSTESDQNNIQCIWCGMFMDRAALGMHFTEVHPQQIIVPNCSLCLQEMIMTARLMEKYSEDFGISLPDEFHLFSSKINAKCSSEKAMDKAIDKYLKRANKLGNGEEEDDGDIDHTISITNSQQSFGRRNRLKRKFVKPCFRQICPTNSEFFEAKSACEWKCRLCNRNVYGAVISAGAIKHYKDFHPTETERMQFELVKARLERIGDGSMEFVHPQLVECLICSLTYALHKPFNICRAIRHLRLKHPEVMPETSGKSISGAEIAETTDLQKPVKKPIIRFAETITDPIELEKFRKENFDQQFDKVQVVYGIKKGNEPAFILLMENETMDQKTAMEMAERLRAEQDAVMRGSGAGRGGDEDGEEEEEENPSGSNNMFSEEVKPLVIDFPEQIVEGDVEEEELEEMPNEETEFMPTYDANNPDHVLIEENEIMEDGTYEMIQDGEYQDIDEDRTVRYLTEEEIREAQARGEILEFEEEVFEEDYTGQ